MNGLLNGKCIVVIGVVCGFGYYFVEVCVVQGVMVVMCDILQGELVESVYCLQWKGYQVEFYVIDFVS